MKFVITTKAKFPCGLDYSKTIEFEAEGYLVPQEDLACPFHSKDCRAPATTYIPAPQTPILPYAIPTACNCGQPWWGTMPPPQCPVHGSYRLSDVWCNTSANPSQTFKVTVGATGGNANPTP